MNPHEIGSAGKRSNTRFPKHLVEDFSKKFFRHDFAVMGDSAFSLTELEEAIDRINVRMRRASQNLDELVRTIENGVGIGIKI